jgi:AcrR family transcriptional regulator
MSTRLPRAERREQILDAATRAFARTGFAATKLEEIAAEAGITQVILYRHFESKTDMYRAVLDRALQRLDTAIGVDTGIGADTFDDSSTPSLLRAAAADPDGYRLLFRHAAREPEFRDLIDRLKAESAKMTKQLFADVIADEAWRAWAAQVVPEFTHEAVIAWLDAGQPDPDVAAAKILQAVNAIIKAANSPGE